MWNPAAPSVGTVHALYGCDGTPQSHIILKQDNDLVWIEIDY